MYKILTKFGVTSAVLSQCEKAHRNRTRKQKPYLIISVLAGGLALLPAPSIAQTAKTDMPATETAHTALIREMTLKELGFNTGLSFSRLAGEEEVFFPLPHVEAVRSAMLVLDLDHAATADSDRFFHVVAGNRIVASIDLDQQSSPMRITVPIDTSLASNGFLPIAIRYAGAIKDRVCVDERASGDFLVVNHSSHLRLELEPHALDTVAVLTGFQPPRVHVALPEEEPSAATISAALRVGTLFNAENGMVSFDQPPQSADDAWTSAHIALRPEEGVTGFVSAMHVDTNTKRPTLVLSGTDPQRALDLLAEPWSGAAGTVPLFTDGLQQRPYGDEEIAFEALRFDTRPKYSPGPVSFDFPFDIAQIPAGKQLDTISLRLSAAPAAGAKGTTAVAFLNDTILGSVELPDGEARWLDLDVPTGLITRDNLLRVQIVRQTNGGECIFASQSYPAQILPGSRFKLTDSVGPATDFHDLRQAMRHNVDLFVDPALNFRGPTLFEWIFPTIASVVPSTAQFRAVGNLTADDAAAPFIFVSPNPPATSDPRLRLDAGSVELRNAAGEVLFTGSDLGRLGIAHIVKVGARQGLWIRPGTGTPPRPTPERALILDHGDVALLNEEGVVVATSTERRDLLNVVYPERRKVIEILNRYRPWILGGAWLLVTVFALQVLYRLYVTRRNKSHDV